MANRKKRNHQQSLERRAAQQWRSALRRQKQRARRAQKPPVSFARLAEAGFRPQRLPAAYRKDRLHIAACQAARRYAKTCFQPLYQQPVHFFRDLLEHPKLQFAQLPFRVLTWRIFLKCRPQRPLATWKPPRSSDPYRVLPSLLQHLQQRYPVPAALRIRKILPGVLFTHSHPYVPYFFSFPEVEYYMHTATGHGMHSYAEAPQPFTRRMNHYLFEAPRSFGWYQAYGYALARQLGATPKFAAELASVRRCVLAPSPKLRDQLLRFWIHNEVWDKQERDWQLEFVNDQWSSEVHVYDEKRELYIMIPPLFPNLQLKGRTPDSLCRMKERWDRYRSRQLEIVWSQPFQPAPWPDRIFTTGDDVRIVIAAITTPKDLVEEGERMDHCVASYLRKCQEGESYIYSMYRQEGEETPKPLLTLEVQPPGRLEQVSGKFNRAPDANESSYVRQFCAEYALEIGSGCTLPTN